MSERLANLHVIAARPSAVKQGGRPWRAVRETLRHTVPQANIHVTEHATHAVDLARAAQADGATLIVAVGGDGTISQIVNGLLKEEGASPPPLAILPLGRGNDYYRTLAVDARVPVDARAAVARLGSGEPRTVDVGRVRYRATDGQEQTQYFINLVTLGFSAAVARSVVRTRWAGAATYLLGLITNLITWRNRDAQFYIDGAPHRANLFNMNVALGRHYGTGMVAAPRAQVDDGHFDAVVMDGLHIFDVLRYMPNNYSGHFDGIAKIRQYTATHVRVEGDVPAQVDGEFVGSTPVEVEMRAARLVLIV